MEHAVELPTRFRSESAPTDGSITITDKKTGRATTVGLTYYGVIAKSLNELFEAEKVDAPVAAEAPAAEQAKLSAEPVTSPEPDTSSVSDTAAPQKAASETKKPTSRKTPSQTKKTSRQNDAAENLFTVAAQPEEKPAPKTKSPRKTTSKAAKAPASKTSDGPAAKTSNPKSAPSAKSAAEVIEGKGFKLMPRADADILTYDIVSDSGDSLGTLWQHQDTGRFHVDPADSEKYGATDHTSLPAAKARVFVISR